MIWASSTYYAIGVWVKQGATPPVLSGTGGCPVSHQAAAEAAVLGPECRPGFLHLELFRCRQG